ncbi:MAG: M23 family metallopeptidase [Bacteroidales bacterium]|nr:M23 family metallopeptidase [Bacteroidales bacterium]
MSKLEKIKKVWNIIVSEWKTRYRLVFSNEDTHEQSFLIRNITIKKMVVVSILAAFVIIVLTTILIALTPLRVYIPGYTDQKDYKLYRQTAVRIDSMEKRYAMNQQYIESFSNMLQGKDGVLYEDDEVQATPDVHPVERDKSRMDHVNEILENANLILSRTSENNAASSPSVPNIEQAKITNISIYPPAMGAVVRLFDASQNHYGIDIATTDNKTVFCVADGVVIAADYTSSDGYTIVVQHPGNMISIYKRNAALLKTVGARVKSGMPIATAGGGGSAEGKNRHLHFELWYNGFPINPLNYLVLE